MESTGLQIRPEFSISSQMFKQMIDKNVKLLKANLKYY
jgi:hypothetical protein